jgi:hypothetical protein
MYPPYYNQTYSNHTNGITMLCDAATASSPSQTTAQTTNAAFSNPYYQLPPLHYGYSFLQQQRQNQGVVVDHHHRRLTYPFHPTHAHSAPSINGQQPWQIDQTEQYPRIGPVPPRSGRDMVVDDDDEDKDDISDILNSLPPSSWGQLLGTGTKE